MIRAEIAEELRLLRRRRLEVAAFTPIVNLLAAQRDDARRGVLRSARRIVALRRDLKRGARAVK